MTSNHYCMTSYHVPLCHTFHSWKYVKPALYKCTQQQPVAGPNKRLLNRRHVSSCGYKDRQFRARSSRPSITKADKADLAKTHALSSEGLDSFPTEEEPYIAKSPQGNAVKVWLFHNHFL